MSSLYINTNIYVNIGGKKDNVISNHDHISICHIMKYAAVKPKKDLAINYTKRQLNIGWKKLLNGWDKIEIE